MEIFQSRKIELFPFFPYFSVGKGYLSECGPVGAMSRESSRTLSLMMTTMFLLGSAFIPIAQAEGSESDDNAVHYGVEYDWSNLDQDLETLSGLDFNGILQDVMDAATEAGFNLVIGQATTGSSNFYVSYTEDHSDQTITNNNEETVDVWSRTTDMTIRHGVLFDGALLTDWSESTFGSAGTSFDISMASDNEQAISMDVDYIEYFNDDFELLGADMDFTMAFEIGSELSIDAEFKGDGEQFNIAFDMEANLRFSLDESHLEWRLGSPSPIYKELSTHDYVYWDCNDESDSWEWENEIELYDDCGSLMGTYASSASYDASVSGIPTEEFLMDAGELDIELRDSASDSGTIEEPYMSNWMSFDIDDSLVVTLDDGPTTNVRGCWDCGPANPLMLWLMEYAMEPAVEGVGSEMADDFEDELGEEFEDPFGLAEGNDGDEMFDCGDGTSIYEWEVNDGWEDCSNGLDEEVITSSVYVDGELSDESEDDWINGQVSFQGLERLTEEQEMNGPQFQCDDGGSVPFDYVNDGGSDCGDGSDEPEHASDFTCSDGTSIDFSSVNDGELDCNDGGDEGILRMYSVVMNLNDGDTGDTFASSTQTLCDYWANVPECHQDIWDWGYSYTSIYFFGDVPGSNVCLEWELYDADNYLLASGEDCEIIGPRIGGVEIWDDKGTSVSIQGWATDVWETEGHSIRAKVMDSSGTTIYSETVDVGEYNSDIYGDEIEVGAEGTFCVEVSLLDENGVAISTETDCTEVEDEPRPSEKLEKIAEAFGNSNLENTLESFLENLEDKFSDIGSNEFPYSDGQFYSFWSDTHATIVGFGLYVEDATHGVDQTLIGPTTAGYSDNPTAPISVVYLTGQAVIDAVTSSADADTVEEIVDESQHDTSEIEQVLEDAGIDPADLGVGDDSGDDDGESAAEKKAAEGGFVPFISPISVVIVTVLTGIIASRQSREEE